MRVRFIGQSRSEEGWWIFKFTVRGFTILGCRWHPESGSVQLPVTFGVGQDGEPTKRLVVRAYGAHILRLRAALEAHLATPEEDPTFIHGEAEASVPV